MTDLSRRIEYDVGVFDETNADPDPAAQLRAWLADAEASGAAEPNSLVLSTVDATGRPSARNLLLRGLDDEGHLVIHTNRRSHKGTDIANNPNVCVLFSWLGLLRQVRIQGTARLAPDEVSDAYFASRPRGSQIGAWASDQSSVLADRAELENAVAEVEGALRGGRRPSSAALGRLHHPRHRVRVLAGASQPAPRSAALLPPRPRLADRAAPRPEVTPPARAARRRPPGRAGGGTDVVDVVG